MKKKMKNKVDKKGKVDKDEKGKVDKDEKDIAFPNMNDCQQISK